MKPLTEVSKVSDKQVLFGKRLGLDLRKCTISVAAAKIQDMIDRDFWDRDLGKPTQKQIELAKKFGYDISGETRSVGSAVIGDIMEQLNFESIQEQDLKPGDRVLNKWDSVRRHYQISSIKEDGLVFFKGGNGRKAWARNLIKVPMDSA